MTDEGARRLGAAIVGKAVEDYKANYRVAVNGLRRLYVYDFVKLSSNERKQLMVAVNRALSELKLIEEFLLSDYGSGLCSVNTTALFEILNESCERNIGDEIKKYGGTCNGKY